MNRLDFQQFKNYLQIDSRDQKGLQQQVALPSHIEVTDHLLNPFVHPDLIPINGINVYFVEGINDMYYQLIAQEQPFLWARGEVRGMYVSRFHYLKSSGYEAAKSALQAWCGVDIGDEAILLTDDEPNYWSLIHEHLHAIFQHLASEAKQELIEATIKSNGDDKMKRLTNMQGEAAELVEPYNIQLKTLVKKHNGNKFATEVQEFAQRHYKFANFDSVYQLKLIDEFIAEWFTGTRITDRFSEEFLPPAVRDCLVQIGYNLNNPPQITRGSQWLVTQ